jgi:hypothetical protein
MFYTIKHKFEVNGKIELIEADGVAKACVEADRRFGKNSAKYLGIQVELNSEPSR